MSNPFRAIGKAFKSIGKIVKKIAVPALVIGAAVLTGGAALGLGLPSLAGVAGKLGLSAIVPALTTAGHGAIAGGLVGLVTGKNVLKSATAGFVTGGVLGGIGQIANAAGAAGKAGSALANVSGAPSTAASTASTAASTAGSSAASTAASTAASAGTAGASSAMNAITSGVSNLGQVAAQNVATSGFQSAMAAAATPALPASGGALGGFFKFMNENPIVSGQMISGVGQGILANERAKEERRAEEERVKRIQGNYAGLTNLRSMNDVMAQPAAPAGPDAGTYYNQAVRGQRYAYNPNTGQIVMVG